ncbi:MAG TPA: DUF192 domain-containing protein [Candidatus Binatia bacterium]|nr:DUF192 domain-containing protein [Candidatus Binatia bacterium]
MTLFSVLLQTVTCQAQPKVTIATKEGRELTFQVEVADTPAKRELGLQYRRDLPPDRGMIFLFPTESEHAFWMKNTPIPLDMIFINRDRKIVGIVEQAVPLSTDSRSVPGASQFVLEINGGLSKRHGIKVGDSVQFQGLSPESVKQ